MDMFSKGVRTAVSVIVGFLGLLALILGVAAEGARQTYCGESNPSTGLGVAAALVLLASQIIANVCGGCVYCCTYKRTPLPNGKRMIAIICLSLSWVIVVVCFFLLFVDDLVDSSNNSYDECGGRLGVLGGGGALSIFSTCIAIAYYLISTSQARTPSIPTHSAALQMSSMLDNPSHKLDQNEALQQENDPHIAPPLEPCIDPKP